MLLVSFNINKCKIRIESNVVKLARISAFDNVAIKILRIIANKQEIVMFII
jgi:hypothetical protein